MYERRPTFFRNDDTPTEPGRRVNAIVKWFNAAKGFGFVTPSDGTQDAFLPMAVLRRAGCEEVHEGASLVCEVGSGAKGPLVVSVIDVDHSTAVARGSGSRAGGGGYGGGQGGYGGGGNGGRVASSATLDGSVKWFEPQKGFGFISPDGGGKDIFIHITALRRSGMETLDAGARVRVDVIDGRKGLEADRITII